MECKTSCRGEIYETTKVNDSEYNKKNRRKARLETSIELEGIVRYYLIFPLPCQSCYLISSPMSVPKRPKHLDHSLAGTRPART